MSNLASLNSRPDTKYHPIHAIHHYSKQSLSPRRANQVQGMLAPDVMSNSFIIDMLFKAHNKTTHEAHADTVLSQKYVEIIHFKQLLKKIKVFIITISRNGSAIHNLLKQDVPLCEQ